MPDGPASAVSGPRKLWWAVLAGVVGLVLVGATSMLLLRPSADPGCPTTNEHGHIAADGEDAVRMFFDALSDRDAPKACAFIAPVAREASGDNPLLSERTLKNPGYFPPRIVRIEPVQLPQNDVAAARASHAWLRVSYEAASLRYKVPFMLVAENAGSGSRRWMIRNPLVPLAVRAAASDTVIIAGTAIRPRKPIVALPGAYVAALPPHPLIDAEPVTALAGPADQTPLHPRVHEGALREIEPQVRSYVDACARRNQPDPDGCPFQLAPNYAYPPTVTRKIIQYPTLRVTESWSGVSVTTQTPGRAEATGPRQDSYSPPTTVLETFTVIGTVQILDGKLVFRP